MENTQNEKYTLELNLKKLISIDDIFNNGTAVKKLLSKGICTSKPEKMSRIYFKLTIEIEEDIIYQSEGCDILLNKKKDFNTIDYLES